MAEGVPAAGRTIELREMAAAVRAWCAGADPALLTGAQAASVAEALAGLHRQLLAKQASMAARAAECNAYSARARSAEQWLARQNGCSASEAKRALDTARRMKACPVAAEAFDRGELSLAEADLVSAAAELDPGAESSLVATATGSHDLREVRTAADGVRRAARSGEAEAERFARLRAGRRWREYQTADGHVGVDARFVPEEFAAVKSVLDAFTDVQFDTARHDGRRESHEAYRADAVLAALTLAGAAAAGESTPVTDPGTSAGVPSPTASAASDHAGPGGAVLVAPPRSGRGKINWNVCVLVDGIALKRGWLGRGETCEIPGVGPVSVPWVRGLLDDAVVDVLIHDTTDIRAYASLTRHKPRPVQLALQARDRRCQVPGCHRSQRLEADHRHDFAKGGVTDSANMGGCCDEHHDEKTYRGARLELTETERLWWPPPPPPGSPPPPEGTVPWRAPRGEHLNGWDLDQLPGEPPAA